MATLRELLAERALSRRDAVDEWYRARSRGIDLPFYSSIDVRDARFKVAPVDSNLYPAGFNNLCPDDVATSSSLVTRALSAACLDCGASLPKRICIIPERHTKNKYYAESLETLVTILTQAGFDVRVGWFEPESGNHEARHMETPSGATVLAEWAEVKAGKLTVGDFVPELIILNNDFSGGYPTELDSLTQVILPSHRLGWHSRKKSTHFHFYNQLVSEYARILEIDPWLLSVDTTRVEPVDFTEGAGMDQVEAAVAACLSRTAAKYQEHGIRRKPFAFVKNNAGTYGIGIMTVHDAAEISAANRRTKNKMSVGKGGAKITSVVVQEGIPTATVVDKLIAEPVIYMFGADPVGGFLRTNQERTDEDNLNSPGMVFKKLCLTDFHHLLDPEGEVAQTLTEGNGESRRKPAKCTFELAYGSVARISALAAGLEIMTEKNQRGIVPHAPSQHP